MLVWSDNYEKIQVDYNYGMYAKSHRLWQG